VCVCVYVCVCVFDGLGERGQQPGDSLPQVLRARPEEPCQHSQRLPQLGAAGTSSPTDGWTPHSGSTLSKQCLYTTLSEDCILLHR